MKNTMIALMMLGLSACGSGFTSTTQQAAEPIATPAPTPTPTPPPEILNVWTNTQYNLTVDLTKLTLNETQSLDLVFACNGTYASTALANGVAPGQIKITGDSTDGDIYFGQAAYQGTTENQALCQDGSGLHAVYHVDGDTLTWCLPDNGGGCATFTKVIQL